MAETIEAMIAAFASQSPGWHDDLLLVDSTPVECARSRETVKRAGASSLGDAIAKATALGAAGAWVGGDVQGEGPP